MKHFKDLNKKIVYTQVDPKGGKITQLKKAGETLNEEGKTAVLLYPDKQVIFYAPGHDPYQIRRDVDALLETLDEDTSTTIESKTKSKSESSR